jgi:predicted MFS family arabinose efflux permease
MKSYGKLYAVLVALLVLSLTALQLHHEGRLWTCACGHVLAWTNEAWSTETSQHLFDPYSLTHVLHGFAFCGLLALAAPRLPATWRLCLALTLESLWEIVENTNLVINRYREATAALGYVGDTVVNSIGDIVACGIGFALARRLGWRRTFVAFVFIELVLLVWIRDSLLLNVLMLLHPSKAIKAWQAGH